MLKTYCWMMGKFIYGILDISAEFPIGMSTAWSLFYKCPLRLSLKFLKWKKLPLKQFQAIETKLLGIFAKLHILAIDFLNYNFWFNIIKKKKQYLKHKIRKKYLPHKRFYKDIYVYVLRSTLYISFVEFQKIRFAP